MKTIHKYEIDPSQAPCQMPEGAEVLSAGVQQDSIFVWALVETDQPHEERIFQVHGTGHEVTIPGGKLLFINTVFMGPLVFHVFERVNL